MSNWPKGEAFRDQKKRTFIYNAPVNRPAAANSTGFPRPTSTRFPDKLSLTGNVPSPAKKLKSSHGFINEQEAADELVRDLPLEAFDDEDLEEDFEIEDELSADELCQAASLAEQDFKSSAGKNEERRNRKSITCDPDMYGQGDLLAHANDTGDDLEMVQEIDKVSASNWSTAVNIPMTETPSSVSITVASAKGTAVLFSGKNDSRLSKSYTQRSELSKNLVGSQDKTLQGSISANSGTSFQDNQVLSRQKEFNELTDKYKSAQSYISMLEDEKYAKDGELKMLRDSLTHFQSEEAKKRDQIREMEAKKQREQSEKEKELQKQVESLSTRLKFKEQEITQVKEEAKKKAVVHPITHVNDAGPSTMRKSPHNESPHRKRTTVSESIPMGSSFYEKGSPKVPKSPSNHRATHKETENSENSYSEATKTLSGISSSLEDTCSAVTSKIEKVLKMDTLPKAPELELLQKEFRGQNAEIGILNEEYTAKFDSEMFITLMKSTQKQGLGVESLIIKRSQDLDIPPTLILFESDSSKKTQSSASSNDDKHDYNVSDTALAFEAISELLDCEAAKSNLESLGDLTSETLSLRNFIMNRIPSAVGFLQLLESHISLYSDLRMELDDDSLTSTSSGNSQVDSDVTCKDTVSQEERAQTLCEARTNAIYSLRCLTALVLYSQDVQNMIFRTGFIASCEEDEDKAGELRNKWDSEHSIFPSLRCDLLDMLLKLLAVQPNEPPTVIHATLHVLVSIAEFCPPLYQPRLYPLLRDGLLLQCLVKNWSPLMYSLVLSILTHLAAFSSAVLPHLCPQTDDCILIKIYSDILFDSDEIRHTTKVSIQQQMVCFLDVLLSGHGEALALLLHTDCPCNMEVIKNLVLMLYKEMKFLQQHDATSHMENKETRSVLSLVRQGMLLLSTLCTNDRLFVEHHMEVVNQLANLIRGTAILFNSLTGIIPESELIALQDLSDLAHNEDVDILQEFGQEEEDMTETMEIDG